MISCKICGNGAGNRMHIAREMMYGFHDQFTYMECGNCGCVQLLDTPMDMAKYYPKTYPSFAGNSKAKTYVKNHRAAYAFGRQTVLGWITWHILGPYEAMHAIRRSQIPIHSEILDVGCGIGNLIIDMHRLGFKRVSGIDPYIDGDISCNSGVKILKQTLLETKGEFDTVMLHHSYEHMADPVLQMQKVTSLLKKGGMVLLRIPVASSYAWKKYGINWMHLDPPRHLFLHTVMSIELIAAQCGLAIEAVFYEGNESQFLGSEQYIKDIPLSDPRSIYSGSIRRWTNWWRARASRKKAEELNRRQEGDLVCFHLFKLSS